MNDSRKSELLSAYLDRETSIEEQAEVEQALESDPNGRQVLEEFAQLGELLRELPEEKVGASFSANVMSRIRETQTASDPAGQRDKAQATAEPVALAENVSRSTASSKRYVQTIIWGVVAVAAALLLVGYPAGWFDVGDDNTPGVAETERSNDPGTEELVGSPPEVAPNEIDNRPPDVLPEVAPNIPDRPDPNPENVVSDDQRNPVVPNNPNVIPQNPGGTNPFVGAEDEQILRLLESLVIVRIECTPPTIRNSEFDKILKRYKIEVAEKAKPVAPPDTVVYYIESSLQQAEMVLNEAHSRSTEFTALHMVTETHQTRNMLNADQGNPDEVPAGANEIPKNGSFADKMYPLTKEQLDAMKGQPGQPSSASDFYPFLRGQSDLDDILGKSPVNTEHLVRMLVVLEAVEPKGAE